MKLNKSIWLKHEYSSKNKIPSWSCPICNSGFIQKDGESINQLYSEATNKANKDMFYETKALAEFRFVGYLKCTNCDERIIITGNGIFRNELDQPVMAGFKGKKYSVFYPKFFEPTLKIIDLPSSLNNDVANFVNNSFTLFWIDLDSSKLSDQDITAKSLHSILQGQYCLEKCLCLGLGYVEVSTSSHNSPVTSSSPS